MNVLVTGASGGIGRATARLFGAQGAKVALLARGETGLAAAAEEVRAAGGEALAVPADVADFEQVREAARRAEEAFGPIDVWVNVAFSSVFAQVTDITPEEYRRITEVTYLGVVNGTKVALDLMLPRDRGAIVQAGSALAKRGIPLQSGYQSQQTDEPRDPKQPGNLWEPVDGTGGQDYGAHGDFDDRAHRRSWQWWVSSRFTSGVTAARRLVRRPR